VIEIDLVDFVLRGTIAPFTTRSTRADIFSLLGSSDQPSYPNHVVYGNLGFDMEGLAGPLALVQIGIPHEDHIRCPHPDWLQNWKPPPWLESWPDPRFVWTLGPFVPDATLPEIQAAIPELQNLKPEEPMWQAYGEMFYLTVPTSRAMIEFESVQKGGVKTLSRIVGPPHP
jgi:hypothetical protein